MPDGSFWMKKFRRFFLSSSLTTRRDADTFHGKEYITFFFAPNEVKNEFGVTS